MTLLIKNGHVVDPANGIDRVCDILVEESRIAKVEKDISSRADQTIDAAGKIVIPGIVDMHVHLREPGREDKETVASGTKAAVKGGVTSVVAMPNTTPALDSAETLKVLNLIIEKTAHAHVYICAAITKGRKGQELTDIAALKKLGAVAISDDGDAVADDALFLEAFKEARKHNLLVICHSEDKKLSRGGVMNLGYTSTRLGLMGISKESEYKCIERDISLAEKTKAKVHIAHVSCKESLEVITRAKKRGVLVTCETAPHYFTLTDEDICDYNTNMKINPPLRTKEDREAMKEGLRNGTIDVIASDHAPHTENEKDIEFDLASFGSIGLETELALGITQLIEPGILNWTQLAEKMSYYPAKILELNKGTLSVGADADIAVISPDKEWVLTKEDIVSKSKNSAFLDWNLKGRVEVTICQGKVVYQTAN